MTGLPLARSNLRRTAGALACVCLGAQAQPTPFALETSASGVFLNAQGDVLTARHAVVACKALHVVKGHRVSEAELTASSEALDLAVLRTSIKPYLSATLAGSAPHTGASTAVFTEAYGVLQHLPDRATLLSNAMTVPGGEGLQLLSGAKPGASGSAVLDPGGLMLGVVVERVASGPGGSARVLSRGAGGGALVGSTAVHAVPASRVREFLLEHGVPFTESDAPQLGPRQSPAARAATLAVGVLCG